MEEPGTESGGGGLRRRICLGVTLFALVLLPGCWSRREINDIAPVMGLGVDAGPAGQLEITFSIAQPPGAAGARGGAQQERGRPSRVVLSRVAPTVSEAIRWVQMSAPRRITLHHAGIVVIGERLAERGTDSLMDFLLRNPQVRLSARILMAKGVTPRELFQTEPLMRTTQSEAIRELENLRTNLVVRLKEYFVARASGSQGFILPVLYLRPPSAPTESAHVPELDLSGGAVFREDRVAATLNSEELRGALWLRGNPREGVITIPCPGYPDRMVSARIDSAHRKIRPVWDGRRLSFDVPLTGAVHVAEMHCALNLTDPAQVMQLEAALSREVARYATDVMRKVKEARTDPFLFGETLRATMPAVWRRVGGTRWEETWAATPVRVTAAVRILHADVTVETPPHTQRLPAGQE